MLTHEKHRMARDPALVQLVIGGFAYQLGHSGWGHALAGALITAACGDETCPIVDCSGLFWGACGHRAWTADGNSNSPVTATTASVLRGDMGVSC